MDIKNKLKIKITQQRNEIPIVNGAISQGIHFGDYFNLKVLNKSWDKIEVEVLLDGNSLVIETIAAQTGAYTRLGLQFATQGIIEVKWRVAPISEGFELSGGKDYQTTTITYTTS